VPRFSENRRCLLLRCSCVQPPAFPFGRMKFIRSASCSACCLASNGGFQQKAGSCTSRRRTASTITPRGVNCVRKSLSICCCTIFAAICGKGRVEECAEVAPGWPSEAPVSTTLSAVIAAHGPGHTCAALSLARRKSSDGIERKDQLFFRWHVSRFPCGIASEWTSSPRIQGIDEVDSLRQYVAGNSAEQRLRRRRGPWEWT